MGQVMDVGVVDGTDLRPEIDASWQRCRSYGLDRDMQHEAEFHPLDGASERLIKAATPVLEKLANVLEDAATAVYLLDKDVRVLGVHSTEKSLVRRLADCGSAPGFCWPERTMGTTGAGLAIETRGLSRVVGGEHFLRAYDWALETAAPVIHPITRRVEGALTLTSSCDIDTRFHRAVLEQAMRELEERLYADASQQERLLLQTFLSATRHSQRDGVLLLTERFLLSNPVAARLLDGVDSAILWEQAVEATSGSATVTHGLAVGQRTLEASFEPVRSGSTLVGALVRVHPNEEWFTERETPASKAPRSISPSTTAPVTSGSAAGRAIAQDVARAGAHRATLVTGEAGSGKLYVAQQIHEQHAGDQCLLVLDAALASVNGTESALRKIADALDAADTTVILQHIDALDARSLQTLGALIDSHDTGGRVIATADADAAEGSWTARFSFRIDVPSLRERLEDLPEIVRELIARHGGSGRMQPAALQALARQHWDGNIRELENVVLGAVSGRTMCDLTLHDLPSAYQQVGRRLSRMERVERAAIVRALAEAGGNRTKAARALEIGRATLYRKIRAYELDFEARLI